MNKITIIKPYDDESLKYDQSLNRYLLTFEYCKNNFDANFRDDGVLERRIKKNTRNVYNFIYSRVATVNKPVVEFLLTRTKEGRKFILDILSAQMEADVESGYNDLTDFSPINLSKGSVLPREEFKRNQVTVQVEQIFDNSDNYFGVRIGYLGMFPWWLFQLVRANS